ncbi:hypothetical protein AYI70_g3265 [Smittium culicis]|uniref:Uncharacterized protein n=1 Tax=Smittium culicis TaxID=133412 RepID=A0A1R1Y4D6_9FUNG|nr:hypothetical protein AYI70_g3265 [Smittium culicis]
MTIKTPNWPSEIWYPDVSRLSSYTRPEKWQIISFKEQIVELDGFEDKQGSLFSKYFAKKANGIMLNNSRTTKRLRQYHPAIKKVSKLDKI